MDTTLATGDLVLVDISSLSFRTPSRGEIILFRNPHWLKAPNGVGIDVEIKRIIGLPGETVHVLPDRVVITRVCNRESPSRTDVREQDDACQTTYPADTLIGGGATHKNTKMTEMFLGPLDYFVMGDNRLASFDSRDFGPIQPENFVGLYFFRFRY